MTDAGNSPWTITWNEATEQWECRIPKGLIIRADQRERIVEFMEYLERLIQKRKGA